MDNIFIIGKITKIISLELMVIEFTSKGVVENKKAYPFMELDEPVLGDEVIIYNLDPIMNSICLWKKLKVDERVGFRYMDKELLVTKDAITISNNSGSGASISISNDNIIKIDGNLLGTLIVNGIVTPNPDQSNPGPFNCLPNCLFTGVPHSGTAVLKI